jgi:N-acetylneuraminic acid mutarotase
VITASNLAAGTYVFSLTVKDNLNATSTTDLVTVTVNGSSSGGTAVRVNAGGSAFLASGSRQFGADAHFSGGTVYANTAAIDNTTDDALYQTERFGNFAYNLPLTSGNYMVTLHFAEIYFGASGGGPGGVGSRKFHVDVEGVRRFTDYDIVARAGGAQKALQETFAVTVSDGTLNIAFATGSADSPKVSAIEVVPGSAPANQPPVLSNAIPDQTATTGTLFNFTFAANAFSDANGDALTYTATLDNNAVLPAWLSFNGSTRTFSGTPPVGSPASLAVKVTADDGKGGTATDTFLISISTSSTTAAWQILQPTAGAPTARHEAAYVQAGNKFYLMGGRGIKPVQVYDPAGRTWTNAAATPIEMHHFQAVTLDGLIYVVGAFTGAYPSETPIPNIYIYNPATNQWIMGPNIPQDRRRGAAGVVVHNKKIYVVDGIVNGHNSGSVNWLDEFDPATNAWTILPNAPRTRDHFHAAVIGNKLYAAGGRRTSASTNQVFSLTVPEVDAFDFTTRQWATLANPIPTLRAASGTVALDGELVVIGGESGTQTTAHKETEALNVSTAAWQRLATCNRAGMAPRPS